MPCPMSSSSPTARRTTKLNRAATGLRKTGPPTRTVPYQNSATIIPPNSEQSTNYCTTMKNRGITIAILYIPYGTIVDPNSSFANNEDGYANNNIANIPGGPSELARHPTSSTPRARPADIQSALVTMFEQAVSTAHVTN